MKVGDRKDNPPNEKYEKKEYEQERQVERKEESTEVKQDDPQHRPRVLAESRRR
ncbi:hypothetical protein CSUI_004994 [Cystoisospora suis]|uniref:Uncharacterized protein n=1 Tax=Cystoisospora suis TaxID=483139 RepID=A0A2C6KZI4_9APIC|nr:hypothetical protein CSUI_004994 [Cystoisospora suis]